jgi:hypothetical protein
MLKHDLINFVQGKAKILFILILLELIFIVLQTSKNFDFLIIFLIILVIFILFCIKILIDRELFLFANIIFALLSIITIVIAIDMIKSNIDHNYKTSYESLTYENHDKLDNVSISSNLNKYNIFFVETNPETKIFTTKQLCAIESAAKNNPNANIYVLSIKALLNEQMNGLKLIYPNIKFIKFLPTELFKGKLEA